MRRHTGCSLVLHAIEDLRTGKASTLDDALHPVRKAGERPLAWHIRERAKDHSLQTAWLVIADEGTSDVQRADLLAAEIARFQDELWPAWQHGQPPADALEIEAALFRAHQTGQQIPTQPRVLRRKFSRAVVPTYPMLMYWPDTL